MIQVHYHRQFIKEFKKLPKAIQSKLILLEERFKENCFNLDLKTKKLQGKLFPFYSFRITREYRVIFQFTATDEVLFLAVKHRKNIYK